MDEEHVPLGPLGPDLADGLQEGLGLDIAHGAADLADDHVHVVPGHGVDPAFDLVGDVGDDLDGGAQVVPPALPVQHGPVDFAGGNGAVAAEVLVHEALVVPQVQVGFRAVLGDEDLAVLVRAHGAGVHVDIGVEFLVPHPDAPLLQEPPQGGRADALAQARDHAAGDKYVFRCHTALLFFRSARSPPDCIYQVILSFGSPLVNGGPGRKKAEDGKSRPQQGLLAEPII